MFDIKYQHGQLEGLGGGEAEVEGRKSSLVAVDMKRRGGA